MEMIGSFEEEKYERLKGTLLLNNEAPNQIWKIECDEISGRKKLPSGDEVILYRVTEDISIFLVNEIRGRGRGSVFCTKNSTSLMASIKYQFRAFRWECVYE